MKSLSDIEDDAAQVLLIATQILFQSVTQTMIKVSGKFVSVLLRFLEKHLNEQDFSTLRNYYSIILYLYISVSIILSYNVKIIILCFRSCCTSSDN